ncbi:MAG: sigma-70 family RNA polymerase sigma factor [Bacteroidota bacterium]
MDKKKYPDLSDQELVTEALGGSKVALEVLVERHYDFVFNVALRMVLSREDAEDITQEVIIKVICKLSQFRQESSFRTWLYRIVGNHFLNMKKRKMEMAVSGFRELGSQLDSIPLTPLTVEEEKILKDQVADARIGCMTGMLLCLDRKQRLVFVLGDMFEVDSQLGGEVLGISPANFRQILSRARKDLYQFMNRKCGLINRENPCRCPKKTKGFIEAGWVQPNNLQFQRDFIQKISDLALAKSNACDNLMEEKYGALFKDHPYYEKENATTLIKELTSDPAVKNVFEW